MVPEGEAIGLFGGTFDPVHNGHVAIARSFLKSGYIDRLWILLTPEPPHKSDRPLSPYPVRLEMLKRVFNGMDNVEISDIETHLPRPSYTVQTIEHLRRSSPSFRFYLCIGEDSLAGFKKWHRWGDILEHCELLVANRPNFVIDQMDPTVAEKCHFIDHISVDISSTELREMVGSGEDISAFVPNAVGKLIKEYHLYRNK